MSAARRPLLTATAAGTLLCALWFVPSANASADEGGTERQGQAGTVSVAAVATAGIEEEPRLAESGGFDTTPYLIGGTAFLGVGIGFVSYAVRRRGSEPL
ncbi:hypothetical protein [Streptomyces yaizuensis]|uniref:LPXTG cell wall anchor domain-containing protein n=1 Tax=Streptomyces yaizuensis TaxID=2989713 RepID=A0ABQ5NVB4_9ACTN|nr:hypothetical protein [Streptomyces sp. YSPA8]GLF94294.1 LPXTG cell wall anchor domain-containing protein [Streptomyces sp. YSPA8]